MVGVIHKYTLQSGPEWAVGTKLTCYQDNSQLFSKLQFLAVNRTVAVG